MQVYFCQISMALLKDLSYFVPILTSEKKVTVWCVQRFVNKCRQDKSNHIHNHCVNYIHLPTILGSITYGTMPSGQMLMISLSPAPLFLFPLWYSSILCSWYGNSTMSPNSSKRRTNVYINSGATVDSQQTQLQILQLLWAQIRGLTLTMVCMTLTSWRSAGWASHWQSLSFCKKR